MTRVSCISFFSTGLNQTSFVQKNYFWFNPLCKILVAFLVAFTAVEKFFRRLWAAEETRYFRNAAGLIVFIDMNAEFLKLRILEAVKDLKINFYKQKFSLFQCPHPNFGQCPLTSFALAAALVLGLRCVFLL